MKSEKTADLSEGDSNLSENRQVWLETLDTPTRHMLDRDSDCFIHQSLSTPCINVIQSCRGSRLTDISGKTYLDFHGNSVHQVGFSNPHVVDAIVTQIKALSFCTRRYTNETAILLAEKLKALAPGKALGHYTHEKNPVACAAALATIECIEKKTCWIEQVNWGSRQRRHFTSLQVGLI